MRWLLLKDLQILGARRCSSALLVLYPVVVARADRLRALARRPSKPRVAFLNEVPTRRAGHDARPASASTRPRYADELCDEPRVRAASTRARRRAEGRRTATCSAR